MNLLNKFIGKFLNLSRIIKRLFSKKIHFNGNSFNLRANNWITKYRFDTFKEKEPETLEWIDDNLKINDVFFDVGANVGIYSLYSASKNILNTNIYSFEPEYSNLNELKFNVINNKFSDKINLFSIAFGEKDHVSFLKVNDVTPGAALHSLNHTYSPKSKIIEGLYVMKIDSFCNELKIYPNLLKIDIDGNEIEFLLGAKLLLKNPKLRSIIIELDSISKRDNCIKLIKDSGFKLTNFHKKNSTYLIFEIG